MYRGLVGRLRSLEKATSIQTCSMAFVEVYVGETLDGALARQNIDCNAYRGLFIVEGREWLEDSAPVSKCP